jgi:AraC-like DNA-binding protein
MNTTSTFLNSIVLLGSLQGFIIGGLLYITSRERPSSKILAWILWVMAMACLKIYLLNIGLTSTTAGSLVDAIVPFVVIMPIGPLIYFYCQSILNPNFEIQRKDHVHFYPVIVDLFQHISAVAFVIVLLLGWANPQENSFGVWFDTYNIYADVPRWISLIIYLVLSFRLLLHGSTQSEIVYERTSQRWLKEFLWVFAAFGIIWLAFLVPYVIPDYTDALLGWLDWYPLYVPIVVMIYWLGIRGILLGRHEIRNALRSETPRLNLPDEAIERIIGSLRRSMEEDRIFLDASLSLSKLSTHVGVPAKTISTVIHQKFGKSFNEFVNQYRINEFKECLLKGENKKYTLTALAYECGFNSQPTFQRAFKSIVGCTPSEFLQRSVDPINANPSIKKQSTNSQIVN